MTIWKVICGNRGYNTLFNYKINEFHFKNPEKMFPKNYLIRIYLKFQNNKILTNKEVL